jgi:hypothetical protein
MSKDGKTKCAVNGTVGYIRKANGKKVYGICPYIRTGDDGICGAHGNLKCQHKRRATK